MNLIIILYLCFEMQAQITYSIYEGCECQQYKSETPCQQVSQCKWNNQSCEFIGDTDRECAAQRGQKLCEGIGCQWDDINHSCYHQQSCDDFEDDIYCFDERMNCYLNANKECSLFTKCEDYSESCPVGCIKSKTSSNCEIHLCSQYQTEKECNRVFLSVRKHIKCQWSNAGTCDGITVDIQSCNSYDNYKTLCEFYHYCGYQDGKCRQKHCKDFKIQQHCEYGAWENWNIRTFCTWKQNGCFETTQQEIEQGDYCNEYKYQFAVNEQGKCQLCAPYKPNSANPSDDSTDINTNSTDQSTNNNENNNSTGLSNSVQLLKSSLLIIIYSFMC